jgi:hypothetical protein
LHDEIVLFAFQFKKSKRFMEVRRLKYWRAEDAMSDDRSKESLDPILNVRGEARMVAGVTPMDFLECTHANKVATRTSENPSPDTVLDSWVAYNRDPRAFWEQVWEQVLMRKIDVPPVRRFKRKTSDAIRRYKFMFVFLPMITENDYPSDFVKPTWERYIHTSQLERRPLPGRWALFEIIAKPNWDDNGGYGKDPLGQDLGLTTRFNISWEHLTVTLLPQVAELLGLKRRAVRQSTIEEWNLIGNLFNWLRQNRGLNLPDLGSTNSCEWCLNNYGSIFRSVIGMRVSGGLSNVCRYWSGSESYDTAFRVLATL